MHSPAPRRFAKLPPSRRPSSGGRRRALRSQGRWTQLRESRKSESVLGRFELRSSGACPPTALKVWQSPLLDSFPAPKFLSALRPCFRLHHHLPHRRSGSRRPLLPPGFQPLASFFDVVEKMRILECSPPRRNNRSHTIPDHPNLAITVEE